MKKLALLLALPLAAQDVRLDDLIAEALVNNPELRAAQKAVEAARARPPIEGALPDPVVTLGYMNVGSPIPFRTIGREMESNASVMFMQELPYPGKRRLRGLMAEKQADAIFQEYRQKRLEVTARLKQAYYQWHYVIRAQETMRRNIDLLSKFARIAEARYTVGRGTQQDVLKAQTEHTRLHTRLTRLEQEQLTLEAGVAALLGRPAGSALGRPAGYERAVLRQTLEEWVARAQNESPMLAQNRREIESSAAGLELARKNFYPDFAVKGGYLNRGVFPDAYEVKVDVKIPLYFWRKQRYEVKEQDASVNYWKRRYESTAQEIRLKVKDAWFAAKASERLMSLYEQGVLPQASLTLESSITAYETGAVDFLTLLTNFMAVLDTDLNLLEETAAFHRALARLEEAVGGF
jgi:outer membrane protein TolC